MLTIVVVNQNSSKSNDSDNSRKHLTTAASNDEILTTSLRKKLKLGSLLLSYVLGFSVEMTAMFVTSRNYFTFIAVTGILITMVQSWTTLLQHLQWHRPNYSLVDFFLWFEASILCYHSGFFCAWALTDYLFGTKTQVFTHIVRELVCVTLCIICSRAVEADRVILWTENTLTSPAKQTDDKRNSVRKLKLGSMTLSYILGYSTHMTAVLVMLSRHSSFISQCLLVAVSLTGTVFQSWITSTHFDWESASSTRELFLWLAASVLSSLSGFSCAWIVTRYWLGLHGGVVQSVVLEIMFLTKFVLLSWAICYGNRSSSLARSSGMTLEEPDSKYHLLMTDIEDQYQAEAD